MTQVKKLQTIWLAMGLGKGTEEYEEAAKRYRKKFKDQPIGFNKVSDNPKWEEMGMFCRWEHCIEMMTLRDKRDENSCPIFGHDCPGGPKQVRECKRDLGYVIQDLNPGKVEEPDMPDRFITRCERCGRGTFHEKHVNAQKKVCLDCTLVTEHVEGVSDG